MKKIIFLIGLVAILLPSNLLAQVGMKLTIPRKDYLQYEPIVACVTLRNDSGRALIFGDNPKLQGVMLLQIIDKDGKKVKMKENSILDVNGLVILPGETKNILVHINKYYDLDRIGKYKIFAYVSHNMLPKKYRSNNSSVDVRAGHTVWQRAVGIPDVLEKLSKEELKERKYIIKMLTEDLRRSYFLIIEDDKNVYAVIRIGKVMGNKKFSAEIDMLSRLHLLIPVNGKVSQYLTFELDGNNSANRYVKIDNTIPVLTRNPKSGRVDLVGGVPAIPGMDFSDPRSGKVSAEELINKNKGLITR